MQPCLILLQPMGCSPPGSSVHGVSQVGILAWAAIFFSRDLPSPGVDPEICIGRQTFLSLSQLRSPRSVLGAFNSFHPHKSPGVGGIAGLTIEETEALESYSFPRSWMQ